jgi:hypothetical protein
MFDLGTISAAHRKFMQANERMVDKVLDGAGKQAEEHVASSATFQHRTGKIKSGTNGRKIGNRMVVSNAVPYASYLELGTKPHTITPRSASALRFTVSGSAVFARRVRHPGTRPYKFLSAARDHAFKWAGTALRKRMRQIASRF